MADFRTAVAKQHGLKMENVALGAGSGEILHSAVKAFTNGTRGLVAGVPTFEAPVRLGKNLDVPVSEVPVDSAGRLDLEKMIAASTGAGLVFVCNPNNPTGGVQPSAAITDLVGRITQASPDTVILIDEAYHEYVTSPSYATAVPLITRHPNVIVARTMSKLYGMAGLRLGYAVGEAKTLSRLSRWNIPYNANAAAGFQTTDSEANFLWVEVRQPAKAFREACAKQGILVGRDFPPFEKTHCRISLGTMDEMKRAVGVFRSVLGLTTSSVSR
jgi:histidinol-phosphate aminotransferase